MRPVGIMETLRRPLAKLVMRASGDQAKTTCGNMQLCAGLEAGIERATHDVGQRRLERTRKKQVDKDKAGEMEGEEEEGGDGIVEGLNNLNIETGGT